MKKWCYYLNLGY